MSEENEKVVLTLLEKLRAAKGGATPAVTPAPPVKEPQKKMPTSPFTVIAIILKAAKFNSASVKSLMPRCIVGVKKRCAELPKL